MITPKEIVFMDDFLAPPGLSAKNGELNAAWLGNMLKPFMQAIAPDAAVFNAGEKFVGKIPAFYCSSGEKASFEAWDRIREKMPNPRQLGMLLDWFGDGIVIGCALSPFITKGLSKLGLPYINFIRHPARFIQGPALGVASNIPEAMGFLSHWRLDTESMLDHTRVGAAKIAALMEPETANEEDVAVFVCQPAGVRPGESRESLPGCEAYTQQIFTIVKKHDRVLVKREGYAYPDRSDLFLTQLCPGAELTKKNFYSLLADPNVSSVYSISSLRSLEASYFGKNGIQFGKYPYKFSDNRISENEFLAVLNPMGESLFWIHLLETCSYGGVIKSAPPMEKLLRGHDFRDWEESVLWI